LLRPLTVAAANAVRRTRVELTVYRPDGGIEATTGFGLADEEREVVSGLVSNWGRELRARGIPGLDLASLNGTRPPAPLIERATDLTLPPGLRAALTLIRRDAALVVPLVNDGEIVGRLSAWSPGDSRPLAQPAILAAIALGEQAGLTIRDARRLAVAERRVNEQAALLRVGQSIAGGADLAGALTSLARAGLGVAAAEGCSLELVLTDGIECVVAADETVAGWSVGAEAGTRYALALAPALAGALRTGLPWAMAPDDPALGTTLGPRLRARHAGRALILPIGLDGQSFGAAILTWRGRRGRPAVEGELGRVYAEQVALALDRLRLAAALRLRTALDAATGLPNRQSTAAQLHAEIARAARRGDSLAVAVVRPAIGRAADGGGGGLELPRAASLLRSNLRAADWVGLVGTDLLLLLPDTNRGQADLAVTRLRARASNAEPPVPALQIGVAVYPDDGTTAAALIAQASARLGDAGPERAASIDGTIDRGQRGHGPDSADRSLPLEEIEAALIASVA
jgi:GGDEF domain-containing protein